MGFFKRLFSSGGKSKQDSGDPNALTYYVKVRKCGAVVRVRVDKRNDLSLDDDGDNYVVRKQVVDNVCYGMAEIVLRFDPNYNEVGREIEGGEFVMREAWEQQEHQRDAAKH